MKRLTSLMSLPAFAESGPDDVVLSAFSSILPVIFQQLDEEILDRLKSGFTTIFRISIALLFAWVMAE